MIRDEVLIKHIRDAISTIEFYVKDMKQNDFLSKENNRTQDAVIRQFEIIGEATGRLSEAIKKDYPDLPWKMIASMRNKLIHEYFGVELVIVWKTITEDLPVLRSVIADLLKKAA